MSYKRFEKNDVFHNVVVTHPEYQFFVYNQNVYLNRESSVDGDFSNKIKHVPQGYLSLHEINVNRDSGNMIYPFINKDGARTAFRTISTSNFQDSSQFVFGDVITGSYPLSASVSRIFIPAGTDTGTAAHYSKKYMRALRNPIESNPTIQQEFVYTNFNTKAVNIVCIPSIFYGSSVKKGSVKLDFFNDTNLIGTLQDSKKDGKLYQTHGTGSGDVAGVILYDYGLMLLTGSWSLDDSDADNYFDAGTTTTPSWLAFGSGIDEPVPDASKSGQAVSTSPSFNVKLEGTNKIPTVTMLAKAGKGDLNYSLNPTFIEKTDPIKGSVTRKSFQETGGKIKNIAKSEYEGYDAEYENITFITEIGIYDKYQNLIGIATLPNPVKKTEIQDYLFKLRLDF